MSTMILPPTKFERQGRVSADLGRNARAHPRRRKKLFYWDGIRSTGIDTLAARAEVAPTTLYRLFASKDDLVGAYVERCSDRYKAVLAAATSPTAGTPRDRILAIFDAFTDYVRRRIMPRLPLPDGARRGSRPAEHRARQGRRAQGLGTRPVPRPSRRNRADDQAERSRALADQLALVAEGVYGSVQALGPAGPAAHGRNCAETLIDAAQRRSVASGRR